MARPAEIAFWTFVMPLASARALRLSIVAALGVFGIHFALHSIGWISDGDVAEMSEFVILPGIPIIAALMSEIPIRDGITHRTLLYPLLGPVTRPALAIVRTIATMLLVAVGASLMLIALLAVQRGSPSEIPRLILAAFMGAIGYVGFFGFIHLVTRRGLIACLAIFGIFDQAIGQLPFSLRSMAPSFHLRVVGDIESYFPIPIMIDLPEGSIVGSAFFLLVLGAGAVFATASIFSRKSLGELC